MLLEALLKLDTLELEVGYGQIPTSANIPGTAINGKVGQLNAMVNLLYDFMPTSVITPYLGVGAGIAFVDSNSSLISTSTRRVAP